MSALKEVMLSPVIGSGLGPLWSRQSGKPQMASNSHVGNTSELTDLPAKSQEVGCSRKRLYKTRIALACQSNQEITLLVRPQFHTYGAATSASQTLIFINYSQRWQKQQNWHSL